MSYIENSSQVTEICYKTIESNLFWEIKNPAELNPVIKSKTVKIPMINGEWYITVQTGYILFYLNSVKEDKAELLKDLNSKGDQYCFALIFNGCNIPNTGFKVFSEKTHEQIALNTTGNYKQWNIEAKVIIKTSRTLNGKLTNFEMKWHKLCNDLGALRSDSTLSDFTIIVKTKEFKVHKSVLSARSPVFNQMFSSSMKEAANNTVEINDIEPNTFEKLLGFIYSAEIPEDLDYYAIDLFVAADKYEIEELKDECEKYISLNVSKDNAFEVFKLSNLYPCSYDLKRISFQILKDKLQENLDAETLEKLLKNKITYETMLKTLKNDEDILESGDN